MPFGRINRVVPHSSVHSRLFSEALNAQAFREYERIKRGFVAATRNPRLGSLVEPMQRFSVSGLAGIVPRIPVLYNQIVESERPHAAKLNGLVNVALRRFFGMRLPEFFESIEPMGLERASFEAQKASVNPARKSALLELSDRLRLQSMLAHGAAFFLQEKMLNYLKPELDKMNPNLLPMYNLLNSYLRVSYYYFLGEVPAAKFYLGKGETKIDFVEMRDKRSGETFFVPTASAKIKGSCFPAMLHEAGEAASHIASKNITANALRNLPANERRFVFEQLHGLMPEIHSHVFGPVAFSSLRKVFSVFASYPISIKPIKVEKEFFDLMKASFPELKQQGVERVIGAWVGFLELPFERQRFFLQASLQAKTQAERNRLATQLRTELFLASLKKTKGS